MAEAREWIGTPWLHQAALKGVGCDCIGLVRGVASTFIGPIEIALDYSERWHLYRSESLMHRLFADACAEICAEDAQPGDVLLFGAGRGPAHHCAFASPAGLIHCYREAGRVIEQTMTDWWRKNLRHAFRFPGASA